jgi:hypothetical protein
MSTPASDGGAASVGGQDGAGDVAGAGRGEEGDLTGLGRSGQQGGGADGQVAADRYQTAAEMRADLQRAASSMPVSAPSVKLDTYTHLPPSKPGLRRWAFRS